MYICTHTPAVGRRVPAFPSPARREAARLLPAAALFPLTSSTDTKQVCSHFPHPPAPPSRRTGFCGSGPDRTKYDIRNQFHFIIYEKEQFEGAVAVCADPPARLGGRGADAAAAPADSAASHRFCGALRCVAQRPHLLCAGQRPAQGTCQLLHRPEGGLGAGGGKPARTGPLPGAHVLQRYRPLPRQQPD